jgi:serine/threonine protein kinase
MAQTPRTLDGRFDEMVLVGSGAMGRVYRAWDREAGTHVAVKLLHSIEAERFEREARVLSQIDHPNIVRYVAHGVTATRQAWLAMEWLEGSDLSGYLKAGTLSPEETIELGRAAAAGLSWAHERGFVHRDLKPSNLFVTSGQFGLAKVVDFGLARDVIQEEALTKTGTLIGTLDYMPPEQLLDAKRVNARADVFSLGAVLYRCLTGRAPVIGRTLPELVVKIMREPIPPISDFRHDVPTPLTELIMWMLDKDADRRPANATAVLASLDGLLAPNPEAANSAEVDYEGVTQLASRPPLMGADESPPSWDDGTLRMSPAMPHPPVFPPSPLQDDAAPPMAARAAGRQSGDLRRWWPVVLIVLGLAALFVARCR